MLLLEDAERGTPHVGPAMVIRNLLNFYVPWVQRPKALVVLIIILALNKFIPSQIRHLRQCSERTFGSRNGYPAVPKIPTPRNVRFSIYFRS